MASEADDLWARATANWLQRAVDDDQDPAERLGRRLALAREIRDFRQAFGLSWRGLAVITGVAPSAIRSLAAGEVGCSGEQAEVIRVRLRLHLAGTVGGGHSDEPITTAVGAAAYLAAIRDDDDAAEFDLARLMGLLYLAHGTALSWKARPLFADAIHGDREGPCIDSVGVVYRHVEGTIPRPSCALWQDLAPLARACCERAYASHGHLRRGVLLEVLRSEWPLAVTPGTLVEDAWLRLRFEADLPSSGMDGGGTGSDSGWLGPSG